MSKIYDTLVDRVRAEEPEALLRSLATSEELGILTAVAKHPDTPPDVLEQFIYSSNRSVVATISQNANVLPEILEKLYRLNPEDNTHVLFSPLCPSSVIDEIIELQSSLQAEKHMNCSSSSLLKQFQQGKARALSHSNYPQDELVKELAKALAAVSDEGNQHLKVVYESIKNPNLPAESLIAIYESVTQNFLQNSVLSHQNFPIEELREIAFSCKNDALFFVAKHPLLPRDVFDRIAEYSPNIKILARIDNLPAEYMAIVEDKAFRMLTPSMREYLASNRSTSVTTLEKIWQIKSNNVLGSHVALSLNPNTPGHVLAEMEKLERNSNFAFDSLLSNDNLTYGVTKNPNSTFQTLLHISPEFWPWVMYHPNYPLSAMNLHKGQVSDYNFAESVISKIGQNE